MIRPAISADLDAVRAVAVAAYTPYVDRMGREPAPMRADFAAARTAGTLHVLEQEGAVCGFIVFYPQEGAMQVENVAVHPDAHGAGHGRRLLDFAETAAKAQGHTAVTLYTNVMMTENFAWYAARGYDEIDRREEDGFHRVYYRKPIPTHRATCHCGGVELALTMPDGLDNPRRCDCSMCRRRGAIACSVTLANLRVIKDATLSVYQFNTRTAKHWFCNTCGIYTHHLRRSDPTQFGVNVGCIEGINPFSIPNVPLMDGINHPADRSG